MQSQHQKYGKGRARADREVSIRETYRGYVYARTRAEGRNARANQKSKKHFGWRWRIERRNAREMKAQESGEARHAQGFRGWYGTAKPKYVYSNPNNEKPKALKGLRLTAVVLLLSWPLLQTASEGVVGDVFRATQTQTATTRASNRGPVACLGGAALIATNLWRGAQGPGVPVPVVHAPKRVRLV